MRTWNGIAQANARAVAAARRPACPAQTRPAVGNQALLHRLQPKLTVGAVDDPLEREADAVADQVMRMPEPGPTMSVSPPRVSRKCAACEEEEDKKTVRMKPAEGDVAGEQAPAAVEDALRSPGRALDASTRRFFERRFGADFSAVKVHDDAVAARAAQSVGALAYAIGNDVVFGGGQFAPGIHTGRRLIAHELAHVVQQGTPGARSASTAPLRRVVATDAPEGPAVDSSTPASAPAPAPAATPQPDAPSQAAPDAAATAPTAAAANGPAAPACADGAVSQDQDPLPTVPGFAFQAMSGAALFAEVTKHDPSVTFHPLGASWPAFDPTAAAAPVKVSTAPDTGNSCQKCIADWTLPTPTWQSLVAQDFVVSDEPKRFPAIRADDTSGCPPSALPHLTEVRIKIPQSLNGKIVDGEREHYNDFKRAYQMTGGRYLANVKRLTVDRSHLRGNDQAECEAKVGDFLGAAAGGANALLSAMAPLAKLKPADVQQYFLRRYGDAVFAGGSFKDVYAQSGAVRDKPNGPHRSEDPAPPRSQAPIFPNIDTSVNPFGCDAYARRFNAASLPGIPGDPAETVIKDLNDPVKRAWHTL